MQLHYTKRFMQKWADSKPGASHKEKIAIGILLPSKVAADWLKLRAGNERLCEAAAAMLKSLDGNGGIITAAKALRLAVGITAQPDEADDWLKPSDFLVFPCCSLLQKTEAEAVAQNIMVICKRRGDRWGELTREDYREEREKDGDFSHGELSYFDKVYPMIDSAAGAASFSSMWRS